MKELNSPNNIHHLAFLCRDAEQTRWFYEDVMGFKLVAALDFESSPGRGEPLEYMHLFFEMGNGDHIAFFDIPDELNESDFSFKVTPHEVLILILEFGFENPQIEIVVSRCKITPSLNNDGNFK